ncbi:MAG: glycosyltransferase [Candidatus Nanoarchaeia archaeon]|nr:glycosyltransferase [Candidatus Nanoarchaeia archaeon]
MDVSLGIFTYNEENVIGRVVESAINQKTNRIKIKEIIVVSSACKDNTNNIIKGLMKKDSRVKLIEQKERKGKASAINLFLKEAAGNLIAIQSGDVILSENAIENLCVPMLDDPKIGFTGSNPIPQNDKETFLGHHIHLHWWLSNNLPRYGEVVGFRNFVKEIDERTAVDEAYIEMLIKSKGYIMAHVPTAVVYNRGPDNFKDLMKQRRRIYVGHTLLKKEDKYSVESFKAFKMIKLMSQYWLREKSIKKLFWILCSISLEVYGRLLGMYDLYILKKNPYIWDIAKSTKV